MRKTRDIPIERVRQVLRYEPASGKFFWNEKIADKIVVGREAGNSTGRRDVRISIDGVLYQGHRLAWAIMTGEQPPSVIDHENRNHRDNRWENLRDATVSQNGANRVAQSNSQTKIKGVHFDRTKKSKPWLARLSVRGAVVLNRRFATQDQAAAAYAEAAKLHFGKYART